MSFTVAVKNGDDYVYIPPSLSLNVHQYDSAAVGGPISAHVQMAGNRTAMEQATKWLGYEIEIYAPNKNAVWWGVITDASFENGNISHGISLESMSNRVRVAYTERQTDGGLIRGETAFATDLFSLQRYGYKEIKISKSNLNLSAAEALRDDHLANHSLPTPDPKIGLFNYGVGEIRAIGKWEQLKWIYYYNSNTTSTATSAQIEAMASYVGVNLSGATVGTPSGINLIQYRDGDDTIQYCINDLMATGVSGGRRYVGGVDRYGELQIDEQEAQPTISNIQINLDGTLSLSGGKWPRGVLPVRKWADLKTGRAGRGDGYFVEYASYNVQRDRYILDSLAGRRMNLRVAQG